MRDWEHDQEHWSEHAATEALALYQRLVDDRRRHETSPRPWTGSDSGRRRRSQNKPFKELDADETALKLDGAHLHRCESSTLPYALMQRRLRSEDPERRN